MPGQITRHTRADPTVAEVTNTYYLPSLLSHRRQSQLLADSSSRAQELRRRQANHAFLLPTRRSALTFWSPIAAHFAIQIASTFCVFGSCLRWSPSIIAAVTRCYADNAKRANNAKRARRPMGIAYPCPLCTQIGRVNPALPPLLVHELVALMKICMVAMLPIRFFAPRRFCSSRHQAKPGRR